MDQSSPVQPVTDFRGGKYKRDGRTNERKKSSCLILDSVATTMVVATTKTIGVRDTL